MAKFYQRLHIVKIFDIHCHLPEKSATSYPDNRIVGCVYNSQSESDWGTICEECKKSDFAFGALGIHPWNIQDIKTGWQHRLARLLEADSKLMVGEIGLDKYKPDLQTQEQVFTEQLNIARLLNRPVQIHCTGAWDKVQYIFKRLGKKLPPAIIFHSFNASPEIQKQLLKIENAYFSFSPRSIKENKIRLLKDCPPNRVLIESDSTNVSDVLQVADFIAKMQPELLEQIYKNSILVLKNGQTE